MANCSLEYPECVVLQWIWLILGSLILLFGTVGNFLTLVVMCSKTLRKTAFGHYLGAIAIFDTMAIWTGMSRHIVKYAFQEDIRQMSVASCQAQRFFLYGSTNTSVWLLAAVTIERFISIYFPAHSKYYRSLGRTKIIIATITTLMFGYNLHIFWTTGEQVSYTKIAVPPVSPLPPPASTTTPSAFVVVPVDLLRAQDNSAELSANFSFSNISASMENKSNTSYKEIQTVKFCGYPEPHFKAFWHGYQTWIGLCIYGVIPFLIMISLNSAIIYKLKERDHRVAKFAFRKSVKGKTPQTRDDHGNAHDNSKTNGQGNKNGRRSKNSSKTRMLLPVTIFFLVVTVPSFVYQGLEFMIESQTDAEEARVEFYDGLVTLVWYLNHSINFLLYCVTGKAFREKLGSILKNTIGRHCSRFQRLRKPGQGHIATFATIGTHLKDQDSEWITPSTSRRGTADSTCDITDIKHRRSANGLLDVRKNSVSTSQNSVMLSVPSLASESKTGSISESGSADVVVIATLPEGMIIVTPPEETHPTNE